MLSTITTSNIDSSINTCQSSIRQFQSPTTIEQSQQISTSLTTTTTCLPNSLDNPSTQNEQLFDSALNELIELLNDEDEVVVLSAVEVVYNIFRNSEHRSRALNNVTLIKTAISLPMRYNDGHAIIRYVAAMLSDLSQTRDGLIVIFENGGLRVSYKLMQSSFELSTHYAITILHNMLLKLQMTNTAVRQTGGICYIVQLMAKSTNTKFLAVIADCLRLLAYGSQDGKELILDYGGTHQLIRILDAYDYEKLLWNAARCIKVLSVCPKNKHVIVQIGGLQTLASQLNNESKRLVMNSLWAIRNLSDIASSQQNLNNLIQSLINLLFSTNDNIVACSACVLANLTCNNPFNKEIAYQSYAVPSLVQVIQRANEMQSIIEPVLMTIRHVTTKHSNANNCRELVRLHCGIQPIIKFLHSPFKWSTTKIAIELIRNLAISPTNHSTLRELNVIERLVRLLIKSSQEMKRTFTTIENMAGILFEDVRVQEIIENILYTFQILEADELNCKVLIRLNFISICYDLICYQNECIIKLAVNCLTFLIHIPSGVEKIAHEDATNVFRRLISSSDRDLSENAQSILLSINEFRKSFTNSVQVNI